MVVPLDRRPISICWGKTECGLPPRVRERGCGGPVSWGTHLWVCPRGSFWKKLASEAVDRVRRSLRPNAVASSTEPEDDKKAERGRHRKPGSRLEPGRPPSPAPDASAPGSQTPGPGHGRRLLHPSSRAWGPDGATHGRPRGLSASLCIPTISTHADREGVTVCIPYQRHVSGDPRLVRYGRVSMYIILLRVCACACAPMRIR